MISAARRRRSPTNMRCFPRFGRRIVRDRPDRHESAGARPNACATLSPRATGFRPSARPSGSEPLRSSRATGRRDLFRTFRNEALEQYRSLFDLASRYTYLSAKSYDYETGLLGSTAGQAVISWYRLGAGRWAISQAACPSGDGEHAGRRRGSPARWRGCRRTGPSPRAASGINNPDQERHPFFTPPRTLPGGRRRHRLIRPGGRRSSSTL